MYRLYIANKNYSSWSLRPWLLMRQLRIAFEERQLYFGQTDGWEAYRRVCPTGKAPCLVDGTTVVWDSLAIVEYLAERHAGVWPLDAPARAWARCAAAEMHSGFSELRNRCSMSCGVRVKLTEFPPGLKRDVERLAALWQEGLQRFGGPYLTGAAFCAVDAFFAPVVFRMQTYDLKLDAAAGAYATRLLELPEMRAWYAAGLEETVRDEPHELEILQMGTVLRDLRAAPGN